MFTNTQLIAEYADFVKVVFKSVMPPMAQIIAANVDFIQLNYNYEIMIVILINFFTGKAFLFP